MVQTMNSTPKVICLGLGRTGTASLMAALNELGFGPCYHMLVATTNRNPDEINTWYNLGQGLATIDDMKTLLKDYNSVLDYPSVIYYDKLYAAYPDAKFILTTRDPAKWEASMKATILRAVEAYKSASEADLFYKAMSTWFSVEMLGRYHQNKLYTDTQNELIAHNERIKQIIPADKLLVYEVSQGWEPLARYLGVKTPDKPFPHVNDTTEFQTRVSKRFENQ